MRAQIGLILGIVLNALAAVDPYAAVAADRREPMQFDLLREGPAEACGSSCEAWVSASGVITADTPDAFERFAKLHDVRGGVIALDSAGGSVHGALLLGRAIRRLAMITTIGKTIDLPPQSDGVKRAMLSPWTTCESMCAFVLLAGIERHVPIEAQVLVHDIWPDDRRNDLREATYSADELALVQRDVAQLAGYAVEMGGTFALLEAALTIPPWEPMRQLSCEELRAMKMVTIDDRPSEASTLARSVDHPALREDLVKRNLRQNPAPASAMDTSPAPSPARELPGLPPSGSHVHDRIGVFPSSETARGEHVMLKIDRPFVVAALLLSLVSSPGAAQTAPHPFSGLAGHWTGSGTISLAGGSQERIRCRASYTVGDNGNALQQSLRCASDSYKFELSSAVTSNDGRLTGTWRETTRNIGGGLEGSADSGRFQIVVSGPAFSASVSLTTRASSQYVVIRSEGSEFKGASITLARG